MKYIIAYDLGTGGTKTSLYDENGLAQASAFTSCDTSFPHSGWHEQRPQDWWDGVVSSTQAMLKKTGVCVADIVALAVSGHSLGVVPIGKDGVLLAEYVPIWSDSRAEEQAKRLFKSIDETAWYLTTGNGFPPPLYSIFKIMWYREHMPQLYDATDKFIGTKDYINYKMTGVLCTDHSYASGSGVYSLEDGGYLASYLEASGVEPDKLPPIYASTHVLGTLLPEAARALGLSPATKVCAGGVDNACMALGAACIANGEAYTSLGTSSWIAVFGDKPIVNAEKRPYVFAHCVPGQYVSATCIFSAGNSLRWVRNTLCPDLLAAEKAGGPDAYDAMTALAATSPAGANGVLFNPSLAGGSSLDVSINIRGCFAGLELRHTRADLIRATLEGVCMNLRLALDVLERYTPVDDTMLIVGGGGKSKFWRSLFASIYEKQILETNVGQDAGSLGAAAVAAVGAGLWSGFEPIKQIHREKTRIVPNPSEVAVYQKWMRVFVAVAQAQASIGNLIKSTETLS